MTHSPKIPKEQRSFADRGAQPMDFAMNADRRDLQTNAQSGQPGELACCVADAGARRPVDFMRRGA